MKIIAKRNTVNGISVYKYQKPQYCCKMLEHNPLFEICDELVVSEVNDDYTYFSDGNQFRLCLCHSEEVSFPYEEAPWEETSFYPISFCPFCGELVEITIIPGENLTEQYQQLQNKMELLSKKYHKTDSKKKSIELSAEIDKINEKIDELYITGEEEVML